MIVQETRDTGFQRSSRARFARRRMLEESALNVGGQTVPFTDESSTETFQDPALRVQQAAGFIWHRPRYRGRSAFLVPTIKSGRHLFRRGGRSLAFFIDHSAALFVDYSALSHKTAISSKSIPPQALAFMAERARSKQTVVVKGASHVVMVSNPEPVARLIRSAATAAGAPAK